MILHPFPFLPAPIYIGAEYAKIGKGRGRQIVVGLVNKRPDAKFAVDCSALLRTLLGTTAKSRPDYCKIPSGLLRTFLRTTGALKGLSLQGILEF